MARYTSRPAQGQCAGRQHHFTQAHLQQIQQQRLIATNAVLVASQRYNAAAAAHQATVDLTEAIIQRWPDCPRFASPLVDRLMAGDEALQQALRSELGDG